MFLKVDAKSSLAVLHDSNDMTNLFRASNWASESKDSIVSREVSPPDESFIDMLAQNCRLGRTALPLQTFIKCGGCILQWTSGGAKNLNPVGSN